MAGHLLAEGNRKPKSLKQALKEQKSQVLGLEKYLLSPKFDRKDLQK